MFLNWFTNFNVSLLYPRGVQYIAAVFLGKKTIINMIWIYLLCDFCSMEDSFCHLGMVQL